MEYKTVVSTEDLVRFLERDVQEITSMIDALDVAATDALAVHCQVRETLENLEAVKRNTQRLVEAGGSAGTNNAFSTD